MWQPLQYEKYSDLRLRPALDLIQQIPQDFKPQKIIDLGCGTGNITKILNNIYPNAEILGLDSSKSMLDHAKTTNPNINFIQDDISNLHDKYDLIFSNAALHWLENHDKLIPFLFSCLNHHGVLAVQIPANFTAPSHQLLRNIIDQSPDTKSKLVNSTLYQNHLKANDYAAIFAKKNYHFNLWETTYYQTLLGNNPIVEWIKGSIVSDLRNKLSTLELENILVEYTKAVNLSYPKNKNNTTIFPFTRLFFILRNN